MKLYKCEFEGCENHSQIRTTIKDKDSEFYGLRVCSFHASKINIKKVSHKTRRTQQARAEQRKNYPEFYQRHCDSSRGKSCLECGDILQGNSTEIVHILSKEKNPELAIEDQNIIYLCWKCHTIFDKSGTDRKKMKVYDHAVKQLETIHDKILNKSAQYFWMFE